MPNKTPQGNVIIISLDVNRYDMMITLPGLEGFYKNFMTSVVDDHI